MQNQLLAFPVPIYRQLSLELFVTEENVVSLKVRNFKVHLFSLIPKQYLWTYICNQHHVVVIFPLKASYFELLSQTYLNLHISQ